MIKNILLIYILILSGCAQFVPPTGGEKDIIPPKLIESEPANQTVNFKGTTITLLFDELIDVSSLRQELIITPQPDSPFEIKAKPTEVTLKFDKPFLDSTTYTFNFGKGIKDLNEKNPAENLKLVFSTTDKIDSLTVDGKVSYLWTGQLAQNILVGLYEIKPLDTIPTLKKKPTYFFKTDSSGVFRFNNIKSSQYRLIAFEDKNTNLFFDQDKEQFGYLPDTIKLDSNISNLKISIYPSDWTPIKVKRSLSRQNNFSITFNKDYESIQVDFPTKDSLTYQFRDKELLFYNHPTATDTVLTKIIVRDSLEHTLTLDQKIYFQENTNQSNPKPEEIQIRSKIPPNIQIAKPVQYQFDFAYPITKIDTNKITIIGDTTYIEKYTYKWLDPSHTSLQITTDPKAQNEIKITIDNGAITNYKSDTNNTYTLINKLYPQTIYGVIAGQILNDTTNHIVQLVSEKNLEIIDYKYTKSQFEFTKVIPGNYYIRVIHDTNENNKWDTGRYETNQYPENITIYPAVLKIKENFEIRDLQIK